MCALVTGVQTCARPISVAPGSEWAWSASAPAPAHAHGEHIVAPGPVTRDVVSFYNIGGALTGSAADVKLQTLKARLTGRSEEHTSELQSLMRISYAVFCLTKT